MTLSIEDATRFAQVFKGLVDGVSVAVLDKRQAVRLALTTMFAGGHLLLEDAPGTGKTALARAISAVIDGTHSRIQFTPDLLPSDITGVNMFNQKTGEWVFHAGPVFAEIVLADEINRASPKTQSALLEVMEEAQVTVDGVRRPAPQPFMVIATQNPVEQAGTYPLPEAQLDRFLMKTSIGYPSRSAMIDVLDGSASPDRSKNLKPLLSGKDIVAWAALASANTPTVPFSTTWPRWRRRPARTSPRCWACPPVAPSAWCAAHACGRPRRDVTSSCPTTSRPSRCPCGRTVSSSTPTPRSRERPPRASSSVP